MAKKKPKKRTSNERIRGRLADLDEEIRRLPRGAPNVDPDRLLQSITPGPRRRRGPPPSEERVAAAVKILTERVRKLKSDRNEDD